MYHHMQSTRCTTAWLLQMYLFVRERKERERLGTCDAGDWTWNFMLASLTLSFIAGHWHKFLPAILWHEFCLILSSCHYKWWNWSPQRLNKQIGVLLLVSLIWDLNTGLWSIPCYIWERHWRSSALHWPFSWKSDPGVWRIKNHGRCWENLKLGGCDFHLPQWWHSGATNETLLPRVAGLHGDCGTLEYSLHPE